MVSVSSSSAHQFYKCISVGTYYFTRALIDYLCRLLTFICEKQEFSIVDVLCLCVELRSLYSDWEMNFYSCCTLCVSIPTSRQRLCIV